MRLVSSWFPALMIVALHQLPSPHRRGWSRREVRPDIDRHGHDPSGAVLPGVTVAKGAQTGDAADGERSTATGESRRCRPAPTKCRSS